MACFPPHPYTAGSGPHNQILSGHVADASKRKFSISEAAPLNSLSDVSEGAPFGAFDARSNVYRMTVANLNRGVLDGLIAFVRTLKQTDVPLVVLHFKECDETETGSLETFDSRLRWSKDGQTLTKLISSCGTMFVGIVEAPCFGARFELAVACHAVIWNDEIAGGLARDGEPAFPCWGTLSRIWEWFGRNGATTRLLLGRQTEIRDAFLARNRLAQPTSPGTDAIAMLLSSLERAGSLTRRLSLSAINGSPLEPGAVDYLESVIFSNDLDRSHFDSIDYLLGEALDSKLMSAKLVEGLDDIGSDYIPFDQYPDFEMNLLARKNRIQEVELLINQRQVPLVGRCIELGSGHGYFSIMLSRSPRVDEAVALDISAATILRWGSIIWDRLKPNWNKLRYVVADMNKLDDEHESYDTVVFCASKHHSSDIPQSLRIANRLLRTGGVVVLYGEHYHPMFLSKKKKRPGSKVPNTISEFSTLLGDQGFKPIVFRYALPGKRFPRLKRFIFGVAPFKYLNGWVYFHSYVMFGIKR